MAWPAASLPIESIRAVLDARPPRAPFGQSDFARRQQTDAGLTVTQAGPSTKCRGVCVVTLASSNALMPQFSLVGCRAMDSGSDRAPRSSLSDSVWARSGLKGWCGQAFERRRTFSGRRGHGPEFTVADAAGPSPAVTDRANGRREPSQPRDLGTCPVPLRVSRSRESDRGQTSRGWTYTFVNRRDSTTVPMPSLLASKKRFGVRTLASTSEVV